jgi:hypothetical protein
MKRIDPVGREWQKGKSADYSTLSTGCKCSTGTLYAVSKNSGVSCLCADGYGTVGTRVNAS